MTDSEFKADIGKLAKGTGLSGFGIIIQKISVFVILAIHIRYLGIERFGAFSIALGISMLLMIAQGLGLVNGLNKFAVQSRIEKNAEHLWAIFWSGMVIQLVTGIFLGFSFVTLASLINERFYHSEYALEAMIAFAIVLPISGISRMPPIMTTSFETNRYAVISRDIVGTLVEVTLLACLLFLPLTFVPEKNIFAVVLIRCVGQLIGAIVATIFFFKLSKSRNLLLPGGLADHIKSIIKSFSYIKAAVVYCMPLMMGGVFQRIIQWTDTIMIGSFLDVTTAGAYRVAVQISTSLTSVLHAIGSIFGPIIARYHHLGQTKMIGKLYRQAARWTLIGVMPLVLVIEVFPESFLLIFSAEAIIAIMALRLLAFGQAFNSMTGNVGIILTMAGKPHWHAINGIVVAVLNVVLCLILIPRYGILGAAFSTALAVILMNSLRAIEIKVFFGFHCISKSMLYVLFPAITTLAVLLGLRNIVSGWQISNIALAACAGITSCLFAWGLHALFFFSEEDKEFVRTIIFRVFKSSLKESNQKVTDGS